MPEALPPSWPLTVRVFGGRLDHRARLRRHADQEPTGVDLACGAVTATGDLSNSLSGKMCSRCGKKIKEDLNPDARRLQRERKRVQANIAYGQYPLPFPPSFGWPER